MGVNSARQFPGLISYHLKGWFPDLPGQPGYNRRLRRLGPSIARVQLEVPAYVSGGRIRPRHRLGREALFRLSRTLELSPKPRLTTPGHHRIGRCPPAEQVKAKIRLVIESVFSCLKQQMRMEDHLAKPRRSSFKGLPSVSWR